MVVSAVVVIVVVVVAVVVVVTAVVEVAVFYEGYFIMDWSFLYISASTLINKAGSLIFFGF